jgi:hypothetical protein
LAREKFTAIYMFLPRLFTGKKKTTVHLRDSQYALFFNKVIKPSFERIGHHFEHHVPGNYSSVKSISQIAAESTGSSAVRGASVEISYNRENLAELWDVIKTILRDADRETSAEMFEDPTLARADDLSELRQFGDPIFLLNRKDTKLLYKSDDTLSSTVDGFWEQNTGAVDPYVEDPGNVVDNNADDDISVDAAAGPATTTDRDGRIQLLDVASEFLPATKGHTVLARRCCQHNTMLFLYGEVEKALLGGAASPASSSGGDPDSDGSDSASEEGLEPEDVQSPDGWKAPRIPLAVTTEYPIHLLRDAVALTCEPTKTSANFKSGLYYAQSYSVLKSIFTKANIWAFSNNEIPNLGHGKDVWTTIARTGKTKYDRTGGDRSLLKSCERMRAAFQDLGRGYGCRLEFRITQRLADRLRRPRPPGGSW